MHCREWPCWYSFCYGSMAIMNSFKYIFVALLILTGISYAYASTVVDQGQPGHQGPWGIYIATLPDGGGGLPSSGMALLNTTVYGAPVALGSAPVSGQPVTAI